MINCSSVFSTDNFCPKCRARFGTTRPDGTQSTYLEWNPPKIHLVTNA